MPPRDRFRVIALFATLAFVTGSAVDAQEADAVRFVAHDIDADFRGGYAVGVADFNNDGRVDVIANSLGSTELAWYENPTWDRHVIVSDASRIVNQAMADIDGDGIPEVAYQSHFAMAAAESDGVVWIARHQGDPTQPWTAERIDAFPTSHHILWADLDGDGRPELINAPLVGPGSLGPTFDQDQASVFWYGHDGWKRGLVTDTVPGIIHRVRSTNWEDNGREQFLVSSFEGVVLYGATGVGEEMQFNKTVLSSGHDTEDAPRLGASDVGVGTQNGQKFFASVEPWHGNEVVVYTESSGEWKRRVIFEDVARGHEVAVVDLNGDDRGDVIANDNSRDDPAVHVFYAPEDAATGTWRYQKIEDEKAMNSCVGADLNNDGRHDLVCTGGGGAIRWYENQGM